MLIEKMELEDLVNSVDYKNMYSNSNPSKFALTFVNFIKLVNGGQGEDNKTPVVHYDMLDQLEEHTHNLFVASRGLGKTSILEYLILFIAVYGGLPIKGYEDLSVGMFIADTMDNGVSSLKMQLQSRYDNSEFLQKYLPKVKILEGRFEFINLNNHKLFIKGFGVTSGVRGFKAYGKRPQFSLSDDLMSDKNANSPTIINDIEQIIYGAVEQALYSPTKKLVIWTGTPFNKKDPLYKAAGSDAWNTRVYPICESFPCSKKEFVGAWEDRFPYENVKKEFDRLLSIGMVEVFNKELMLRIISDEDRLVNKEDIVWFKRDNVLKNKDRYNFYITTDFAVSDKHSADYSVILVWAYTSNGDWLLVDGVCNKQLMDKNIDDLFSFVAQYKPFEVGVEITGQQKGFISWMYNEMVIRNCYFTFASDKKSKEAGIRPSTDKLTRFSTVVPLFKSKKIWFPEELKGTTLIIEALDEILHVTTSGMKARHDDLCFIGGTKLKTYKGLVNIEDVRYGDSVLAFTGTETVSTFVTDCGCTGISDVYEYTFTDETKVRCTNNHPFLNSAGNWESIDTIFNTGDSVCKLLDTDLSLQKNQVGTTSLLLKLMENVYGYTKKFTEEKSEIYQKGSLFTIETIIKTTTQLIILHLCLLKITLNITAKPERKLKKNIILKNIMQNYKNLLRLLEEENTQEKLDRECWIKEIRSEYVSIVEKSLYLKKETETIQSIVAEFVDKEHKKRNETQTTNHSALWSVKNAVMSLFQKQEISFVAQKTVENSKQRKKQRLLLKSENACSALQTLVQIVQKLNTVQIPVEQRLVKHEGVLSKEYIGKFPVYNVTTDKYHNYVLFNDMVVHNCDCISQLPLLKAWKPSEEMVGKQNYSGVYESDIDDVIDITPLNSYIV